MFDLRRSQRNVMLPDALQGSKYSAYIIRLVNVIGMRNGKAVVLVKHYRSDIHVFLAIALGECFGQGDWQVIESRDCMLWKTQSRISD